MASLPGTLGKTGKYGDLKRRLFFLLGALIVYRIGTHIPVPGIDPDQLRQLFNTQQGGILGLFNMFSGGALSRFSVFALGIMPYISASIIMQMMTYVLPSLEALRKEGESGRRKITQYTRYGTLALAIFQAIGISVALESQQGLVIDPGIMFRFISVVSLVTGTMFLMWLGEQITERGLGNGISILIFAGIVAGLPSAIGGLFELVRTGAIGPLALLFILALIAVVTAIRGVRRARPAQDPGELRQAPGRQQDLRRPELAPAAQAQHGRRDPADLRLEPDPVPGDAGELVHDRRRDALDPRPRRGLVAGPAAVHPALRGLIIFFCFFYTALVFNSKETADNLKKSGAFVPGIRPGDQTARYIDKILMRLTLTGALYITFVCLVPEFLNLRWQVPFYFGGTSLLIVVVVTMDFMSAVQSYLMTHQYESLLKKANFKGSRLRDDTIEDGWRKTTSFRCRGRFSRISRTRRFA